MQDNAADRRQVRRAEKRSKLVAQQHQEVVKQIMSTTAGRAWVCDMLEFCHVFADPFTGEALVEAHSKGERNVGLRLLDDITRMSLDEYILMLRERNTRDTTDDRRNQLTAGELPGSPEPGGDPAEPDPDSEPGDEVGE